MFFVAGVPAVTALLLEPALVALAGKGGGVRLAIGARAGGNVYVDNRFVAGTGAFDFEAIRDGG